jgi:hypothetical protein
MLKFSSKTIVNSCIRLILNDAEQDLHVSACLPKDWLVWRPPIPHFLILLPTEGFHFRGSVSPAAEAKSIIRPLCQIVMWLEQAIKSLKMWTLRGCRAKPRAEGNAMAKSYLPVERIPPVEVLSHPMNPWCSLASLLGVTVENALTLMGVGIRLWIKNACRALKEKAEINKTVF